jgi:hypothetical protein
MPVESRMRVMSAGIVGIAKRPRSAVSIEGPAVRFGRVWLVRPRSRALIDDAR